MTKGGILTDCENTVMSYCCDRSRSVTWGINGGLPRFLMVCPAQPWNGRRGPSGISASPVWRYRPAIPSSDHRQAVADQEILSTALPRPSWRM